MVQRIVVLIFAFGVFSSAHAQEGVLRGVNFKKADIKVPSNIELAPVVSKALEDSLVKSGASKGGLVSATVGGEGRPMLDEKGMAIAFSLEAKAHGFSCSVSALAIETGESPGSKPFSRLIDVATEKCVKAFSIQWVEKHPPKKK